jgi:Holliday junction resolvasome RuvABC endonuclease subunit
MIILGIDPGLRNLGWAKYDTDTNSFVKFGKYDLTENVNKQQKTKYTLLVKNFIDKRPDIFENIDIITIEMQMAAKFKVISTAFQCFFWGKSHLISPRSVRCHFKISTGNYKKNKKASIDIIPKLPINKTNITLFNSYPASKKDDVADAILIALYYAQKLDTEKLDVPTKRKIKKRRLK